MKFNIIVADCPWKFRDSLTMKSSKVKRSAESQYSVMTIKDIINLPVQNIIAKDAILLLWCPAALLPEGLQTMKKWGFKYKGIYVWGKTTKDGKKLAFNMGRTFRSSCEIALYGTRGKFHQHLKNRAQRNLSLSPNKKHSEKPEDLQNSLDIMFSDPNLLRIELFARRVRSNNWTCIGNEITGNDIKYDIETLSYMSENWLK